MKNIHVMQVSHVFKGARDFHLRGFFLRQQDMALHTQEFFEIVFILDGSAMHCTPGRKDQISRGDILIIPAGGSHGYEQTDRLLIFNLLFVLEDLDLPQLDLFSHPGFRFLFQRQHEYFENFGEYPRLHFPEPELSYIELLLRKLAKTREQTGGKCARLGYLLVIISIICDHWGSVKPQDRDFSPGIVKTVAYIGRHFREQIYLEQLAGIAAMSKNSLLRNFRRIMHCSPMDYLLQHRLEQACRQLLGTTLRIKEIAAGCGFSDLTYFTRIFKKKMGCTPGAYRRGNPPDRQ